MDEKLYKKWDIIVKILGFVATAASIYIGISQFSAQQKASADLEVSKNFWTAQNEVYTEVCNNAGAMAANFGNSKEFEVEKTKFLTHYYGQMVLVKDDKVSYCMAAIKNYLNVFDLKDINMRNILIQKILNLSNACRNSSITFKRTNLK